MNPDHPVALVANHLVQAALVTPGKDMLHRPEVRRVDLHYPQRVFRLAFGQTDAAQRRVAEDRAGNAGVIDCCRLVAENGVGESLPLADRHRSQLNAVGYVADRVDAVDAGLAEPVDLYGATLPELHPGLVETQALGVRKAAGGVHHAIDLHVVVIGHRHLERATVELFDAAELGVEAKLDALHERYLQQPVAKLLVVAAQDLVGPVDDGDLRAELVEDAGEFVGDVPAAGDQDALRQLVEVERLVTGDAMLVPRTIGNMGPSAGGDKDVPRSDFRPVRERHFVGAADRRALRDNLDLVVL